jgi:NUMOD3 motif
MGQSNRSAVCEICKVEFATRSGKAQTNRFCSRTCYLIHHANETHIVRACLHCGQDIRVRPSEERRGIKRYCTMECRKALNRTKEHRCGQCKMLFTPIVFRESQGRLLIIVSQAHKMCSRQCLRLFYQTNEARKEKISKAFQGKNHPNWTGGASQQQKGYRGPRWKRVAEKVRKRQHYRCAACDRHQDETGRKLDVNHVERYHNFTDHRTANRLSNLIALCHSCHMKHEQRENVQLSLPWGAGSHGPMQGEQHYAARFSNAEVRLMRILKKDGMTYKAIGLRFGIKQEDCWQIVNGKSYKHV